MSGPLSIAILGAPALLLAGLGSGFHCALMCAPLHARIAAGRPVVLQAGRLSAYTVLGAAAGALGGGWLRPGFLTDLAPDLRLVVLAGLALTLLLPATAPGKACCVKNPGRRAGRGALGTFGAGVAAGLAPCFVLYGALAYAALAGSAAQGALLMLSFGLGTLPAIHLGTLAWRRLAARATPPVWRRGAAVAILAVTAGMALLGPGAAGGSWCVG